MNLNSGDYKSMICARADHIRVALYPDQYGRNAAVQPAAVAGFGQPPEPPQEIVPDFIYLKLLLDELREIADAFETSIGPA